MDMTMGHLTYKLKNVAEDIEKISNNAYVSMSLVISIIGLTAWFITFKVNAEASIRELASDTAKLHLELKEMKSSLPSRDWLELKFENLEAQLGGSKKMGK